MRLFQRNKTYYFEVFRGKRVSLKTKDRKIAEQKAKIISSSFETIRLINKIEDEKTKLLSKLSNGNLQLNCKGSNGKTFASELEMQETILPKIVSYFSLENVEQFRKSKSGILDVFCTYQSKKLIIEFKLGTIREDFLGQCLRYLSDKQLEADELWLVGQSIDKSNVGIFKQFPKIKLFRTSGAPNAKKPILLYI